MPRTYEDFVLDISPSDEYGYTLRVVRSAAGECTVPYTFPYDTSALQVRLKDLQIALLRSGGSRRKVLLPEESTVRDFGAALYDSIFTGEVRSIFEASQRTAADAGHGLRLRLRIQSPSLAALPWEYLFDKRLGDYVALATDTPLVRHLPLTSAAEPLAIRPPLRVLGMIASPANLAPIDVRAERATVETALRGLIGRGIVDLQWVQGQGWRDLRQRIRDEPWHVVHFMGHGSFDPVSREGQLYFADENRQADSLTATEFNRVLAGNKALRLVLLNACQGAESDDLDIFSSTAATLVRGGVPAVIAMQYEITDAAATEFARSFYEALVDGLPVDAAVDEARRAISVSVPNSLEWGIPVLFMRSPDGRIFAMDEWARTTARPAVPQAEPGSAESAPVQPIPVPIPPDDDKVVANATPAVDKAAQQATETQSGTSTDRRAASPTQPAATLPAEQRAPTSRPLVRAPTAGSDAAKQVVPKELALRTDSAARPQSRLWWAFAAIAGALLVAALWYIIATNGFGPVKDSDGDGLPDEKEIALNIDPFNNDWDGDGLLDGREVNETNTDPRSPDTDGDGLKDGREFEYGADPLQPDTDADGLTDGEEVDRYKTSPSNADTNGNGIGDKADVGIWTDAPATLTPKPLSRPTRTPTLPPSPTPKTTPTRRPLVATGDGLVLVQPGLAQSQATTVQPESVDATFQWNTMMSTWDDQIDMVLVETDDPAFCAAACQNSDGCKFWAMKLSSDGTAGSCNRFASVPPLKAESGWTSGLPYETAETGYQWNTVIKGDELRAVVAASPQECARTCTEHDGCSAWSYQKSVCESSGQPACRLHGPNHDSVEDPCFVAGKR